jgi:CubicO group peptidase (beta-lactamase class C family)
MKCCTHFSLLLLGLWIISPASATEGDPQLKQVQSFVEEQMKAQHIPGLTLLIKRDGKVWLREAYGVSNRENKRKTEIQDRFDRGE